MLRITKEYFRLIFGVFLKNLRLRSDLCNSYKKETVYKHRSLSGLTIVLIESFLSKLYERCTKENVRYTPYFEKYNSCIPWFLKRKPKLLVANLLKKWKV